MSLNAANDNCPPAQSMGYFVLRRPTRAQRVEETLWLIVGIPAAALLWAISLAPIITPVWR